MLKEMTKAVNLLKEGEDESIITTVKKQEDVSAHLRWVENIRKLIGENISCDSTHLYNVIFTCADIEEEKVEFHCKGNVIITNCRSLLKRVDCIRFDIQSFPEKVNLRSFIIERF